jgi:hypothetical protein
MDRDTRRVRVTELERWLAEQHAEFEDEALPDEVRALWDASARELADHRRTMTELEMRDEQVGRLCDPAIVDEAIKLARKYRAQGERERIKALRQRKKAK